MGMLKSSGAMAGATMLSRVLGMVREMVYAAFMGDTAVASAFKVAFQIPNLFRRLLGEGALTGAFIPIFKNKEVNGIHVGLENGNFKTDFDIADKHGHGTAISGILTRYVDPEEMFIIKLYEEKLEADINVLLYALNYIKENNLEHPEIVVVFSVAEEIGLLGAKAFEIEKYNIDYGFILDSGGKPGKIITQAPSAAKGTITIIGKPAHAGIAPENGINALVVASDAITKMKLGRIDAETTSNIGIIHGGEAVNIVMPEVAFEYEARSLSNKKLEKLLEETKNILKESCEKFGAKLEEDIEITYKGFSLESTEEIVQIVKKACENLGITSETLSSGGGSDTNIYNSKGIKSVNLAVGMSKVHTVEEYIEIVDLVNLSKLLLEIVKINS